MTINQEQLDAVLGEMLDSTFERVHLRDFQEFKRSILASAEVRRLRDQAVAFSLVAPSIATVIGLVENTVAIAIMAGLRLGQHNQEVAELEKMFTDIP